jgi:hypothetical protein
MPRYSLRRLLVVVTVIAVLLAMLRSIYIGLTRVETGENVARVDWLPATATNVSYYKSYPFKSYEFDISEEEFREWAWWDVQPITEPIRVARYNFFSVPPPGVGPFSEELVEQHEAYAARFAVVSDGLGYVHRQSNGGGVWVAYDRKRGRAFFHSAPR